MNEAPAVTVLRYDGETIDLSNNDLRYAADQAKSALLPLHKDENPAAAADEQYMDADPDVYRLKDQLLQRHQVYLSIPPETPIKILFKRKPRTLKGRQILGSVKLFSELDRFFHPYVFLITLDYSHWLANPNSHAALLLHELCHCGINEKDKYCVLPHDLEEFAYVVKHYGAWEPTIQQFSHQLTLFNS